MRAGSIVGWTEKRCRRMNFVAQLSPVGGHTLLDDSDQQYRDPDGNMLVARDAGQKAALDALADRWPWTLSWQELVDAARARLGRVGRLAAPDLELGSTLSSSA